MVESINLIDPQVIWQYFSCSSSSISSRSDINHIENAEDKSKHLVLVVKRNYTMLSSLDGKCNHNNFVSKRRKRKRRIICSPSNEISAADGPIMFTSSERSPSVQDSVNKSPNLNLQISTKEKILGMAINHSSDADTVRSASCIDSGLIWQHFSGSSRDINHAENAEVKSKHSVLVVKRKYPALPSLDSNSPSNIAISRRKKKKQRGLNLICTSSSPLTKKVRCSEDDVTSGDCSMGNIIETTITKKKKKRHNKSVRRRRLLVQSQVSTHPTAESSFRCTFAGAAKEVKEGDAAGSAVNDKKGYSSSHLNYISWNGLRSTHAKHNCEVLLGGPLLNIPVLDCSALHTNDVISYRLLQLCHITFQPVLGKLEQCIILERYCRPESAPLAATSSSNNSINTTDGSVNSNSSNRSNELRVRRMFPVECMRKKEEEGEVYWICWSNMVEVLLLSSGRACGDEALTGHTAVTTEIEATEAAPLVTEAPAIAIVTPSDSEVTPDTFIPRRASDSPKAGPEHLLEIEMEGKLPPNALLTVPVTISKKAKKSRRKGRATHTGLMSSLMPYPNSPPCVGSPPSYPSLDGDGVLQLTGMLTDITRSATNVTPAVRTDGQSSLDLPLHTAEEQDKEERPPSPTVSFSFADMFCDALVQKRSKMSQELEGEERALHYCISSSSP